jgi:hypothetical protein
MNNLSPIFLVPLLLISTITAQAQRGNNKTKKLEMRQKARVTAQKSSAKWHLFISPDEDFTLEFPIKPIRLADVQNKEANIRHYGAETTDIYFDLNFQDLLVPTDDPAYSTFGPEAEIMRAQSVSRDGSRVISYRRVAPNISDMERWQATGQRDKYINLLTRSIIYNGRLYVLGCSSRPFNQEVDKGVCRRFFNSFHIIREPQ